MGQPFFSVVIPVYNRSDLILKTLESVLGQDYSDFEIVVVDDGSTDRPDDVVAGIGDARVRLVRQANAGGGAARNLGIDESRGKYIAFLDSDDLFLPNKLSTIAATLDGDPSMVVYSSMYVDRGVERYWIRPTRGIVSGEDVGEYLFVDNQFIQTSTMVVPTVLAREVRFDPSLRKGQDLDFCVRLQACGARFRMVDQPLTIWFDNTEVGRTSYVAGYETSKVWLHRCGHLLTKRAYLGYRATILAYHAAPSHPFLAAKFLLSGLFFAGVSVKTIARQTLRSFLPRSVYRHAVNFYVARLGRAQ